MRTRQQNTKGWVIFAAFCAVLFCMTVLRACAAKTAPEGCSLERVRPMQAAAFPLGTDAWRVSDAYGWRTDPLTGEKYEQLTNLMQDRTYSAIADNAQMVMVGTIERDIASGKIENEKRVIHLRGTSTIDAGSRFNDLV